MCWKLWQVISLWLICTPKWAAPPPFFGHNNLLLGGVVAIHDLIFASDVDVKTPVIKIFNINLNGYEISDKNC